MPSIGTPKDLTPARKVTPTNAEGKANSDANPTFVKEAVGDASNTTLARDTNSEILVELRVISRLLAQGFNFEDDLASLRDDESAGLGL